MLTSNLRERCQIREDDIKWTERLQEYTGRAARTVVAFRNYGHVLPESRPRDIASQIENYQARDEGSFFCLYEETIKAAPVFKIPR